MGFTNSEIEVSELPTITNVQFRFLDKNYHKLLKKEGFVLAFALLLVVIFIVITYPYFMEWPWILMILGPWAFISIIFLWHGFNAWKYKGYVLREHDILFKSGILFKSTIMVPFNRVQHVDIRQGPLDRLHKIVTLTLYTAGGSANDLSIPGLNPEEGTRLKNWIMQPKKQDEGGE